MTHFNCQKCKIQQNVFIGQVKVAKEMSNIKGPFSLLQFRLSLRKPGFNPRPFYVQFRINKMELGHVFLRVLRFSPVHCSIGLLTIRSSLATNSVSPFLPHSSPQKSVPFLRGIRKVPALFLLSYIYYSIWYGLMDHENAQSIFHDRTKNKAKVASILIQQSVLWYKTSGSPWTHSKVIWDLQKWHGSRKNH
jgi:hypothetical protein